MLQGQLTAEKAFVADRRTAPDAHDTEIIKLPDETYKRTGYHTPRPKKFRPLQQHIVPQSVVDRSLLLAGSLPPLNETPGPSPVSNNQTLNQAVETILAQPRWYRAYHIHGHVSVHPRHSLVYENGNLFEPSSGARKIPFHNSYLKLLTMAKIRFRPSLSVTSGLLLRHPFERNYYHSIHDMLTRLAWADEIGIPKTVPVIISDQWVATNHGRQLLASTLLKGRKLIVQPFKQHLVCENLYLLQPPHDSKELLQKVAASLPEAQPETRIGDNLVLVRGADLNASRTCDGFAELAERLVSHGFQAIDPATLTLAEQKWVFARAKIVVGENGAGFTNMIFCKNPNARFIALTSNKFPTSTFQNLSKSFGFFHKTYVLPSQKTDAGIRSSLTPIMAEQIARDTVKMKEEEQ